MKSILISGIGGDISQCVARIVRERRPDLRVIGVDMDEKHAGMLFLDEFRKIPPGHAVNYLKTVRSMLVENDIDTIIPMTEPELRVIRRLVRELGSNRCITSGE